MKNRQSSSNHKGGFNPNEAYTRTWDIFQDPVLHFRASNSSPRLANHNMDKMSVLIFYFSIIFTLYNAIHVHGGDLDHGLGEDFAWRSLDQGLIEAKESNMPLMLIIHKSWCGACKKFRPNFAKSEEIKELSKQFVMVNVEDDDEPNDAKYKPDGGYVPRILFMASNGDILTDVFNIDGNPNYKYFYPEISSIVDAMVAALDVHSSQQKNEL